MPTRRDDDQPRDAAPKDVAAAATRTVQAVRKTVVATLQCADQPDDQARGAGTDRIRSHRTHRAAYAYGGILDWLLSR